MADASVPPYSTVGLLAMIWSDGSVCYGSGALVDEQTVLTCAHNLIDQHGETPQGSATKVYFYPGFNEQTPEDPPPGGMTATAGIFAAQYYGGDDTWDVGICRLAQPVRLPAGAAFFMPTVTGVGIDGDEVDLTGYPGNHDGEMWSDAAQVYSVDVSTNTIEYAHDTFEGSSGSPVYTYDPVANAITQHAVHVADLGTGLKSGTLMSPGVVDWVDRARAVQLPTEPYFQLYALGRAGDLTPHRDGTTAAPQRRPEDGERPVVWR